MPPKRKRSAVTVNKSIEVPKLDIENHGYDSWKGQIDIWCEVCKEPVKERGMIIRLTLDGPALAAAEHVPKALLKSEDGVQLLLEQLDRLFIPDAIQRDFAVQNTFYRMLRPSDRKICDFVNDFADQYLKYQRTNADLPEKSLAFMLLSACNLTADSISLVMASSGLEIKYIEMQNTLKRIFATEVLAQNGHQVTPTQINVTPTQVNSDTLLTNTETNDTKDNSVLMSNNNQSGSQKHYDNNQHNYYTRGRSLRRNFRRNTYRGSSRSRGKNPLNRNGNHMACLRCESIFHLIKDCPENDYGKFNSNNNRNNSNERKRDRNFREHEVNFSYFFVGCASANSEDKLQDLLDDSNGYAILDSGCTNTVAGVEWFTNYTNNLSTADKMDIQVEPSNETFTFGDGKQVKSMRRVTFPCWSGGKKGNITADIVQCKIPLLMSKKSMSRAKMILDFGKNTASIQGRIIKLKTTRSGHYALPLSL